MSEASLQSELLTRDTVGEAIALANTCFPKRSDQKILALDYYAFLRGKLDQKDPMLGKDAHIIGYYLFRRDGQLVGVSGAYQYADEPETQWLSWLAVHPEYRRHGVGREIVEHAAGLAKESGKQDLACITSDAPENGAVHHFYEKLGFTRGENISFRDEVLRKYVRRVG